MDFETYLEGLQGKTAAVIGIGVSNRPLIELLLRRHVAVTARDRKSWEALGPLADELAAMGCRFRLGEDYLQDLTEDITGRDILVVEDILDSGNTLSYLLQILQARKPASMRLCTLLDKPERRVKPVEVHYTGFSIPDEFVVGYGLDYAEKYRNLPYIGILKPAVYGGE